MTSKAEEAAAEEARIAALAKEASKSEDLTAADPDATKEPSAAEKAAEKGLTGEEADAYVRKNDKTVNWADYPLK